MRGGDIVSEPHMQFEFGRLTHVVTVRLVKITTLADTPYLVQIWGDVEKPLGVFVTVHITNGSGGFTTSHSGIDNSDGVHRW